MKEKFIERDFKDSTLVIIDRANDIIEDYREQGFLLTVRQIYYQFIGRDVFPESWIDPTYNLKNKLPRDTKNTTKNYKRLAGMLNDGRLAGLIDWLAIEDRTRNVESHYHFKGPQHAVQAALDQYQIDMWETQPTRVEVWIEKEALVGVIANVCNDNDVPYFACRGFVSQSEAWRAYCRALQCLEERDQDTIILHFGDHDPSGMDMTRDNQDRFNLFLGTAGVAEVRRLALNMDQIERYNPPPNPAKTSDSRYADYAAQYGNDSWELDALEPAVIGRLIQDEIDNIRDETLWAEKVYQHTQEIEELGVIVDDLGQQIDELDDDDE